jgi:23S rRNA pseudouridine2457 synthase
VYKFGNSTWLLITLTEGKFRQVRKMIAAVRHKCLRLIRVSIENISLDDLQPGEVLEMKEDDFFEKLNIKKG